jgi:hypothetical protein
VGRSSSGSISTCTLVLSNRETDTTRAGQNVRGWTLVDCRGAKVELVRFVAAVVKADLVGYKLKEII